MHPTHSHRDLERYGILANGALLAAASSAPFVDGARPFAPYLVGLVLADVLAMTVLFLRAVARVDEAQRHAHDAVEELRLILNSTNDGIYGLDAQGKTRFANRAALEMTGYTREEMIGAVQHARIHPSQSDGTPYPQAECHIYAALTKGSIQTVDDEVFRHEDGHAIPIGRSREAESIHREGPTAQRTPSEGGPRRGHPRRVERSLSSAVRAPDRRPSPRPPFRALPFRRRSVVCTLDGRRVGARDERSLRARGRTPSTARTRRHFAVRKPKGVRSSILFSACPHDTLSDPGKWASLASVLASASGLELEFVKHTDFERFASDFRSFQLVYAHPIHAVQLAAQFGFVPLASYEDVHDEAVIASAAASDTFDFDQLHGKKVACIVPSPSHAAAMIAIARRSPSVTIEPVKKTHYPAVALSVRAGEAAFGIFLESVWEDMPSIRKGLFVRERTKTRALMHVFMASPQLATHHTKLKSALVGLADGADGRALLKRLGCRAIAPLAVKEFKVMKDLLAATGYATGG